jgi:hypothetical protein
MASKCPSYHCRNVCLLDDFAVAEAAEAATEAAADSVELLVFLLVVENTFCCCLVKNLDDVVIVLEAILLVMRDELCSPIQAIATAVPAAGVKLLEERDNNRYAIFVCFFFGKETNTQTSKVTANKKDLCGDDVLCAN